MPISLKIIAVVFIANIALFFAISGHTQCKDDSQSKDYLSIEAATKFEIEISKAPGSISVINLEQIHQTGAKTIPELLRLVPGVNVRWNPMMQTITMRGFGQSPFTSRVLLLIDGIPYNSWNKGGFPQQPGFDFFPLENVKRIEVVRGPGSALYGENAYWGVLNIVSLSGHDLDCVRASYYSGSRHTQNALVQAGKEFKDWSVFGSVKYLKSQFPMEFWYDDENEPKVAGSDIFIKANYDNEKFGNLALSYYRHDDQVDGYTNRDTTLPPVGAFKSSDSLKQTVDIFAAKYARTTDDGDYSFATDLSYARRNGAHCANCHSAWQDEHFQEEKEPHGFQAIGDFRLRINRFEKNDILLGMEIRREDAGEHSEELLTAEKAEHLEHNDVNYNANVVHAYTKTAFYFQDMISLMDDHLYVTVGGRYDAKTHPELFDSFFSPRIAGVFKATKKLSLRAGWGKAFRFLSFSELYQNTWFLNVKPGFRPDEEASPLVIFEPNSKLKPEEISTFELGAEYLFNPSLTGKIDIYHSKIDNFIVAVNKEFPSPAASTTGFENHPDGATITGSEFELRWKPRNWIHGFLNWSYKHPKQDGELRDTSGMPIELIYASKHQINLGGYFEPFKGFSGALEVSWVDKYMGPSFIFSSEKIRNEPIHPLDDFTYLNLRLNYTPPFSFFGAKEPLRFSIYLKNLLDERPEENLGGLYTRAPGREIFGGVELQF